MEHELDSGPYRIVEKLGEGGMGVVYRAVDTRLDRPVALKVLAPHLSADSAAAERFVREAQVAASAEHTNICTIYEIGRTGNGRRFIAMPLYEGRTVRDLIDEGPLEIDVAIDITIQAARGLDAAHARGVTHRDIKPGNLIVTGDGTVKILDFGLARTVDQDTITGPGATLGTAAYMSPEQVQGDRLDGRTDIWSVGVVLHEMVSGARPFRGEYPQAVVYGILNEDPPPLTSLRSGVPIGLDAVVAKCLRKDRDSRYQHVDEIPADLRPVAATLGSEKSTSFADQTSARNAAAPVDRRRWWPIAAAAAAVAIVGTLIVLLQLMSSGATVEQTGSVRFVLMMERGSRLANDRPSFAISNDGTLVTYASVRNDTSRLYVRPVDSFGSRLLGGTEGAQMPFFSPDGRWIVYFTAEAVYRVSSSGGRPEFLAENIVGNTPIASGTWTRDDRIVFTTAAGPFGIVSPQGEDLGYIGDVRPDDGGYLRFPDPLPDGRHVVASLDAGTGASRIVLVSLDDGSVRTLIASGTHPRYLPSGHLVYAIDSDLYVVPFDPGQMEVEGEGERVMEGLVHGLVGGVYYDVSDAGTLLYVPEGVQTIQRSLAFVDSTGVVDPLLISDNNAYSPKMSPDGRFVAYQRRVPNDLHLFVLDIERGSVSRFTSADASVQEWWFAWTPDSRSLVFNTLVADTSGPRFDLLLKSVSDPGSGTRLSEDPAIAIPQQVSDDGRYLLYVRSSKPYGDTNMDIWVKDLQSGGESPVIADASNEFHPALSPDGRWLAFASDRTGAWQTFVQPWPEGGSLQQVSTDDMGGGEPTWSADGNTLFYRSRDGRTIYRTGVYENRALQGERSLRLGKTAEALRGPYFSCSENGRSYEVEPDGRFLMVRDAIPGDEMGQLNVVLNWMGEVRRVGRGST